MKSDNLHNSQPQLETLIAEIRAAARSRTSLWLPLMGCLSLIDICASLERPDTTVTTGVGARFKAWIEANMPKYSHRPMGQVDSPGYFDYMAGADMTEPPKGTLHVTAESIYQFRCSLLHEGTTHLDSKGDFDKILFSYPRGSMHVTDSVYREGDEVYAWTDLLAFADAVCDAAEQWLAANRDHEPVKTNLSRLLSLHARELMGQTFVFVG